MPGLIDFPLYPAANYAVSGRLEEAKARPLETNANLTLTTFWAYLPHCENDLATLRKVGLPE